MSKGITFDTEEAAREYASQKESEGYRVAKSRKDGIYTVVLLGTDYQPMLGKYEGKGETILSRKASTKTRLHELAHKKFGHEPGWFKTSAIADSEIDAEIYTWRMMDKEPTHRVGLQAYAALVEDYGYEEDEALRLVVSRLRAKGITVTEADYEDLKNLGV